MFAASRPLRDDPIFAEHPIFKVVSHIELNEQQPDSFLDHHRFDFI